MVVLLLLACPSPPTTTDSAGETGAPDTVETSDSAETAETGDTGETGETAETGDSDTGIDGDGDGYPEGDDCDDANPYVYPGATEYCDALDEDCDGDALAPGVCSQRVALEPVYLPLTPISNEAFAHSPARDLTGDGLADILTIGLYDVGAVYERDQLGTGAAVPTIDFEPAGYFLSEVLDAGDLTGDGVNDVVMVEQYTQSFIVFHGPLAPVESIEEADAFWSFGAGFDIWCTTVEVLGDVNGDGAAELGCSTTEVTTATAWFLVGGAQTGASYATQDGGSGGMANVGDLDGDGIDEVLSISTEIVVIPGDAVVAGAVLDSDSLSASWPLPDGFNAGDPNDNTDGLGDLDGNGYPSFYISNDSSDPDGAVHFFEGPVADVTSLDDAPGVLRGGAEGHVYGGFGSTKVIRYDDTGLAAALQIGDSETYTSYVVPAEAPVGVVEINDWPHITHDLILGAETHVGTGRTGVDVTGDGIGDYAGGNRAANTLGIIPGFVPPWDDAMYW